MCLIPPLRKNVHQADELHYSGIGYETTLALAAKSARVFLLARSGPRAQSAIQQIKALHPNAQVEWIEFDLCNVQSCRRAAEEIIKKVDYVDMIANNAGEGLDIHSAKRIKFRQADHNIFRSGIMATPYRTTDGIENQFYNHLGHFALVKFLGPLIRATAEVPLHIPLQSQGTNSVRTPADPANCEFNRLDDQYGSQQPLALAIPCMANQICGTKTSTQSMIRNTPYGVDMVRCIPYFHYATILTLDYRPIQTRQYPLLHSLCNTCFGHSRPLAHCSKKRLQQLSPPRKRQHRTPSRPSRRFLLYPSHQAIRSPEIAPPLSGEWSCDAIMARYEPEGCRGEDYVRAHPSFSKLYAAADLVSGVGLMLGESILRLLRNLRHRRIWRKRLKEAKLSGN